MSRHGTMIAVATLLASGCRTPTVTPMPSDRLDQDSVTGEVTYIERSGANLYLEVQTAGGKTIGVELLPDVASTHRERIRKGMPISAQGRRTDSDDDSVAFVLEVSRPDALKLSVVSAKSGGGGLASLKLWPRSPPGLGVETIAAIGAWPPIAPDTLQQKIDALRDDGASRLVIDVGLTELWRAYRRPEPFYTVLRRASGYLAAHKLSGSFYLPAFEIRREKGAASKQRRWTPRWAQVTLAGRPLIKTRFEKAEFWNKAGDVVVWVCPNSPWRQVFFNRLGRAVLEGARSLFVDVPYFQQVGSDLTCRCKHCQARFTRDTGLQIPRQVEPDTLAFRRWLWWRHETLLRFLGELRQHIRGVEEDARLLVEEYPSATTGGTWRTGLEIALANGEADQFVHELSLRQFDKRAFTTFDRLKLAATLILYRGLDGSRPTWVLSYAHAPADSRISAAFHLAYDASFWETRAPEMNDTTVGRPWRKRLFGWVRRQRQVFGRSRQLGNVVLLYSPASRLFAADHFATLNKVLQMLVAAGIPTRVLAARRLAELRPTDTVVLPAATALADETARRLKASGAKLIVVGASPSKDRWGLAQRDHHLTIELVEPDKLVDRLDRLPLRIDGEPVAANLVQRPGELQLRLVSLRDKPARVSVRLLLGEHAERLRGVSVLPFLGDEIPLRYGHGPGGELQFFVQVTDLSVIRLRLR